MEFWVASKLSTFEVTKFGMFRFDANEPGGAGSGGQLCLDSKYVGGKMAMNRMASFPQLCLDSKYVGGKIEWLARMVVFSFACRGSRNSLNFALDRSAIRHWYAAY